MQSHEIAKVFSREYNGQKNFMTPDVERYGKSGPFLYEISTGTFGPDRIWGFTVLEIMPDGAFRRSKRSQCCHSRGEVQRCIDALKGRQP